MIDEGYVKNVGWRKIYDIKWFKRRNIDIGEGYYLRHSKYLLRSPGLIPRPLGRKNCAAGNGFAKLFSKASPIPRRLRRGWFI